VSDARLFRLASRAVIEVTGADRVRWLAGMISADVKALGTGQGAWGLLLTRQGRVVADLHVLVREESLWLELESSIAGTVRKRLESYVIADDVTLRDGSAAWARLALEGPGAQSVLEVAAGSPLSLAPGAWCTLTIAAGGVAVAAYGFTGGAAFQLFAPREAETAVVQALVAGGAAEATSDSLECLRIESGLPRVGFELDETVLPAEAGLEAAISETTGCYPGQAVVTRMRTRGRVAPRLVGLRFEAGSLPARGAEIERDGSRIGQVTSTVLSPAEGPIGLGYVTSAAATAGGEVEIDGTSALIVALPFR
jgi:aminomethyltransferase